MGTSLVGSALARVDWLGRLRRSALIWMDGEEQPAAALVDGAPSRLNGGARLRLSSPRDVRDRNVLESLTGVPAAMTRRIAGSLASLHEHKQVSRSSLDRGPRNRSRVGAARGGDTMRLARLAHGAVFVVFLPVGLLPWARATSPLVRLPVIHVPEAGAALDDARCSAHRRRHPRPDRARPRTTHECLPPPHLVRTRIYRWVRDPIYIGFVLACAGVSIAAGSPAGLWIVTPVTALACAALVYGYERHDLRRRFGKDALQPPVLSIPPDDDNAASATHRAAVFLWVLIPWVVIFYAVQALGRQADAFGTMLPFESGWTVLQWTELGYVSAYLFIPVTVLLIRTQRDLRRFAVQALIAIVVVSIAWLTIPVVAINRPFIPTSALGRLLALEQAHRTASRRSPRFTSCGR